jgi:ribosomal 50S subunit-associated protein YjgA (DUF615 family)
MNDLQDLAAKARNLANQLLNDVELTTTREEHIRLMARANEADGLATSLYTLAVALLADNTL